MRRLPLILLCLALPSVGMAQIYRWTDANGQIHYTQTPPMQGQYQRVHPAESSGLTTGNLGEFVQQSDQAKAEADKAHEAQMQAKAQQAEACAKVRERISLLEEKGPHRLFVKGSDGQPSRMTDDQYNTEMDQARQAESANCH